MAPVDPRDFGRIEAQVAVMAEQNLRMEKRQEAMLTELAEIRDLISKARGARLAVAGMVGVGGALGGLVAWLAQHAGMWRG